MKLVYLIIICILLAVFKAGAQKRIAANQAVDNFNEFVDVSATVKKFRQMKDSAILMMGERPRRTWLMVILKDSAFHKLTDILDDQVSGKPKLRWRGYPIHAMLNVKGIVRNLNGRAYIVVNDTFEEFISIHEPRFPRY